MHSEKIFLEISKIPNRIWKSNKIQLSPKFDKLWLRTSPTISLTLDIVQNVVVADGYCNLWLNCGCLMLEPTQKGTRLFIC